MRTSAVLRWVQCAMRRTAQHVEGSHFMAVKLEEPSSGDVGPDETLLPVRCYHARKAAATACRRHWPNTHKLALCKVEEAATVLLKICVPAG
jgi:hypothetical protein